MYILQKIFIINDNCRFLLKKAMTCMVVVSESPNKLLFLEKAKDY